jgi:LytS/YehU family sensor histidine kinase
LLAVVVPQIAFTYFLLYYLLPGYFFKRKNLLVTACVISSALLLLYFLASVFKVTPMVYNLVTGMSKEPPSFANLRTAILIDQVTSLPIVVSFAVMIKLIKRWWLKQKQTEQLAREKTKAELQLLKAQVHPHFLFNTLNNIYFFTLSHSPEAPGMIRKLSGLLHYIINECNQPLVPLAKEIEMIRDYMALEKIRYGEQLNMTIEISGDYHDKMIAPLLLIPFVENSFKHGASKMIAQPLVKLCIRVENNIFRFTITNSKPLTTETSSDKAILPNQPTAPSPKLQRSGARQAVRQGNIGLKNVTKRLELLYPSAHECNIVSESGEFTVYLTIQLLGVATPATIENYIGLPREYELA